MTDQSGDASIEGDGYSEDDRELTPEEARAQKQAEKEARQQKDGGRGVGTGAKDNPGNPNNAGFNAANDDPGRNP